jgi:hypothetical protein
MHYFAPAFRLRTGGPRRRQIAGDDEEADQTSSSSDETEKDVANTGANTQDKQAREKSSTINTLLATTVAQYQAAGLTPNEDLPKNPFPHAPDGFQLKRKRSRSKFKGNRSKSTDDPASVPLTPLKDPGSLRQHHVAVLTTLLHRCLLDQDFERAGRAWGMLLRSEFNGSSFNVKTHDRWGIGAEVLLRRGTSGRVQAGDHAVTDMPDQDYSATWFSDEGFSRAKEYYERLILQFPAQRTNTRPPNSLTFYSAMFSLWIYQIQQKSKREQERLQSRVRHLDTTLMADESETHRTEYILIKQAELDGAREFENRMDELLSSPPFDNDVQLLHIRGMIALWIGDLLLEVVGSTSNLSNITFSSNDTPEGIMPEEQHDLSDEQGVTGRAQELQRAVEIFQKVKKLGGEVPEEIEKLISEMDQFASYPSTKQFS